MAVWNLAPRGAGLEAFKRLDGQILRHVPPLFPRAADGRLIAVANENNRFANWPI